MKLKQFFKHKIQTKKYDTIFEYCVTYPTFRRKYMNYDTVRQKGLTDDQYICKLRHFALQVTKQNYKGIKNYFH